MSTVATVTGIPEDKQVLLISNGEALDPTERVCSYSSAGTVSCAEYTIVITHTKSIEGTAILSLAYYVIFVIIPQIKLSYLTEIYYTLKWAFQKVTLLLKFIA